VLRAVKNKANDFDINMDVVAFEKRANGE